jgi:hypothetical protein
MVVLLVVLPSRTYLESRSSGTQLYYRGDFILSTYQSHPKDLTYLGTISTENDVKL